MKFKLLKTPLMKVLGFSDEIVTIKSTFNEGSNVINDKILNIKKWFESEVSTSDTSNKNV